MSANGSFVDIIKSCGYSRDLSLGREIHAKVRRSPQLCGDVFLANMLIQMYGRCGSLCEARAVLDDFVRPNLYSWNLMLTAYARNGHLADARELFDGMPQKDAVSWNVLIAAYSRNGDVDEASALFAAMPCPNEATCTAMIAAYAKAGQIVKARTIFDSMPRRDLPTWNAMLAAYVACNQVETADRMFKTMANRDVVTWTTMVSAYARVGHLVEAKRVFDEMPGKDAAACNALIQGYVRSGMLEPALEIFSLMARPDEISWTLITQGLAQGGRLDQAREIYARMPVWNVITTTAMIVALSQGGRIDEARALFDRMPRRDVAAWNAMINGYCKNSLGREAIALFRVLDMEGVGADKNTLSTVLDACADLSWLPLGRSIHAAMAAVEFEIDVVLGTAIVSMYGRCGDLVAARSAFEAIAAKNVVSWSAIIAAYAHNGRSIEALGLFQLMNLEGVLPVEITFVSILSSCSHAGMIADGMDLFAAMSRDYGLVAGADHYPCVIDLLGRAGWLAIAEELVHKIPSAESWATLLGACNLHSDAARSGKAAGIVSRNDPQRASPYVVLSSTERALTVF
ncbi:pentatricopeptide repeat-containing protein At4g02750 [Selaginella moellendorffii]|uniref:pentatricopeptide repeat-containing protein At4g02750 n=1 Tax=Selaginella moellendorffii TaxID=88036 RepID=UPI000D1CDDCB|nr:pentatricopeptide repeat-containing protein At4g02750 [Selaginella moellendorffii]XP_024544085.1 pentatricopeptide repeat-containing protein At4g02750 [Selaginella moellendorffii]XP_024544086.1 pentatricopeptide repeat-containing protein At4g02750 [Selaginella moellendorffii]XP_024544087.1 pentatricopeptide repeat-containing protein At4g02750 [Selaginella moellendorffii]XP_024544088.1 pentatricopeptide repeat-containing protein At4g02750 [Selaginella moellendorffii]XP_024544089.1 pentatrico|eukprot:XP_002983175.2 pentatricopeptide repeat-containing protein At4g02750 [Selaginella moellendorffii]